MDVTFILTFVINPSLKYGIILFYCIDNLMIIVLYFLVAIVKEFENVV